MPRTPSVEVVESYREYEPPFPVVPIVHDLLRCVPRKYLNGLGSIILTDAAGQSRRERRKTTLSHKKKVSLNEARGFYQPAWDGEKPYIQLHVDRVAPAKSDSKNTLEQAVEKIIEPVQRRFLFAMVLYHELGHHIHFTKCPEHRERENVADKYRDVLIKRFFLRRLYLLIPLAIALPLLLLRPSSWKCLGEARSVSTSYKKKKADKATRRKKARRAKREIKAKHGK